MDSSTPLIVGSSLVLLLYLADVLAFRWRIPSVLFMILLGWMASLLAGGAGAEPVSLRPILPTLGLLGLGLVVLDGALELRLERGKGATTLRAAATAILALCSMTLVVGAALRWGEGLPWRSALLGAIPLSIVSSAIAIPSSALLDRHDRDHVAIESSLSDIAGVLLFNAFAAPIPLGGPTFLHLGSTALLTAIVSTSRRCCSYSCSGSCWRTFPASPGVQSARDSSIQASPATCGSWKPWCAKRRSSPGRFSSSSSDSPWTSRTWPIPVPG